MVGRYQYKGTIWVGTDDVPARLLSKAIRFTNRGDKEWALLDYATFKKVVSIAKYRHLKSPEALYGGEERGTFNTAFECFIG